ERISNEQDVLRLIGGAEHIWLENEIRSRSGVWGATSICGAKQRIVQGEAGQVIARAAGISTGSGVEVIGVAVARVNAIICFVIFTRCRHGGDFTLSAGEGGFLACIANRAQD